MISESYIISAKRTPIGSFQGLLSSFRAPELCSVVIESILSENNLVKDDVDEVILGNVLSSGIGQAPARQAAIYANLSKTVECLTINKMCGSGLKASMLADQAIRVGDAGIIICGGMESMSNAPFFLPGARVGYRLGHNKIIDSMVHDGLWDSYMDKHMGSLAELCAKEKKISRKAQDEYSIESYKRALEAQKHGIFDSEIQPIGLKKSNGETILIKDDEEPKKVNFNKIPNLNPVFENDGTITAANASKINDGAAVLIMSSKEKIDSLGLKPQAKLIAQSSASHEPEWFTTAPTKAIQKVLKKANLSIKDIGLWEINEAFAVVVLSTIEDFNLDRSKVNIYGGAIALGHPIGASGARILTTLINGMKKNNAEFGLATICIGGGEASAVIIKNI